MENYWFLFSQNAISLCKLACKYSWIFLHFQTVAFPEIWDSYFYCYFFHCFLKIIFTFPVHFVFYERLDRPFIYLEEISCINRQGEGVKKMALEFQIPATGFFTPAPYIINIHFDTLLFKKLLVSGMRCSLASGRFISFVKRGKGGSWSYKKKTFFLKATKAFDEQCVPTGINLMNKLRENPLLKKLHSFM